MYFSTYYPDYDVSLWLTGISIGAGMNDKYEIALFKHNGGMFLNGTGAVGTLIGGYLSDKLVYKMGISARALVLALSQVDQFT